MEYDVSLQTIAWINELHCNGYLEINPAFQRRAVWLEEERSQLLNTIISSLPFPEIYFQVETDVNSGKQKYIVVDGQQRTTSILKFIDNEFSLPDRGIQSGKYFRDLDDTTKKQFWNYKVVVRLLKLTNDAEIRDLFQRLNTNNLKLTDQELRNARYAGKFKDLCERLADAPFFQTISLFTSREVRRMLDIEFVSELVLQQIYGVTNKKDLLDIAYSKFDEDLPNEAQLEEEFDIVINLIRTIITDDNALYVKTKTNFYTLFGTFLDRFRKSKEKVFKDSFQIANSITEFLRTAREEGEQSSQEDVRQYSEAYSRAASDKGRRIIRQRILSNRLFI